MAQAKKRKRFFEVDMPILGKETDLQAYEQKEIGGRIINYDLTRSLKGKSMILQLEVKAEKENLVAHPIQAKVLPYFLRRMIRKGTNYVEDSFIVQCENSKARIKPFLITRRKVSRAVRKALREKAKEEILNYVKDKTTDEIFDDIIKSKIQRELSSKLKKIYPLSLCEIRIFKVEKK
ncbi:hypothetical protein J4407_03470 [Candidatus Pacearchaeota archaeon]|nr:hypothetical protein [Candidatus Pacearchaeota archaeon]